MYHINDKTSTKCQEYCYDLENELKLQIKTNEVENNLYSFEFEFNYDNSIIKNATIVNGSYNCYLEHNITKRPLMDLVTYQQILCFLIMLRIIYLNIHCI